MVRYLWGNLNNSTENSSARTHVKGWGASFETGTILVQNQHLALFSDVQLTYQQLHTNGYKMDVVNVASNVDRSFIGRLALRIAPALHTARTLSPYLTVNFSHEFLPTQKIDFGEKRWDSTWQKNWITLGVGATHQLNQNLYWYGSVDYAKNLTSNSSYSVKGNLGIEYRF